MIAQRFRAIGWVAGCAVAALCCYLASQSVAAERAALARVDSEIGKAQDDIRRLNTEIAARSRMAQIERWNTQVLALQAPAPAQFVANEVQLASLAGGKPLPLDPNVVAAKGAVSTVAYQPDVPKPAASAPVVVPAPAAQPLLRTATFVRPKPGALDQATAAPIVKASFTQVAPTPKIEDAAPAPKAKVAADKADRKAAVAERTADAPAPKAAKKPVTLASASLLPSDLGTLIAAERKGAKATRPAGDR